MSADDLTAAIARATNQDESVLALFRTHLALTPSTAHALYIRATGKGLTPLTSIRRSITVLTGARVLRKTPAQLLGPCGSPETVWEIAP